MTKKILKENSFMQVVLIALAVVLFWRGAWGLMDLYLFPDHEVVSYFVSIILGFTILLFTKKLADTLT